MPRAPKSRLWRPATKLMSEKSPQAGDFSSRLVSTFDEQARIRQRRGQPGLDARRLGAGQALQVQRRPGEHFEAALENAAGRVDAGLVLIEALRGRIAAHAD